MPPKKVFRTAIQLLCWEGAFAMAYDTWVGPQYLSGLAGELGVNVRLLALVTALPFIGSVGQLFSVWALHRLKSLKSYCLALALAGRALWTLPPIFALVLYLRASHLGQGFPAALWFSLVACIACAVALVGSSSGVAWNSWMLGLVPHHMRGRFFGARQRFTMGAVLAANLIAAAWVEWKPHGLYLGYAILGALAVGAAATSTYLLSKVPDVASPAAAEDQQEFVASFLEPFRDRKFRKVVLFGALFTGAIQISGPYFPYFCTHEVHVSMRTVALWLVGSNVGCFLAATFWGRKLDCSKDPLPILGFCCTVMALSPLPYTLSNTIIPMIAPFEYFSNGIVYSGYLIATAALLYSACPRERNVLYFSVYAAACGIAGAICTFVGGHLSQWLIPWGGFRALWFVAIAMRLTVVYFGLRNLRARVPERVPELLYG